MDSEQLRELATNARLNHWPPHLGVTTDAEKIEYLTRRLEEVADTEDRINELSQQLETVEAENETLEHEAIDRNEQIEALREDLARLESKLKAIQEIVS